MDKFSGLFIKANGEWQVHGKIDSDVDGKIDLIRKITDKGGEIKIGQKQIKAEQACIIHSTKGVMKRRNFA